ncbi:MAG: hypothetical protein N3G76_00050 [Candidatus Micrarchaeota archaeon]|nr:hypothetical protein [Candidatus Micrarchaeota archaeon]
MGDFDKVMSAYLGYVDRVRSFIPYKRVALWKDFFLNPLKVIGASKDSIMTILKDLYMMGILSFIIWLASAFIPQAIVQLVLNPGMSAISIPLLAFMLIASIVFLAVLPLMSAAYAFLEFIVAKLVGGSADFSRHLFASAMPQLGMFAFLLPITILQAVLGIFSIIPFLGLALTCLLLPLQIVVLCAWLYTIYLKFLSFKEVHKVSGIRAAAIIIIPLIVIAVLVVALAMLFYTSIMGFLIGTSLPPRVS